MAIFSIQDIGVDISQQGSKLIDELRGERFDAVVAVCGNAKEGCPPFSGKNSITCYI